MRTISNSTGVTVTSTYGNDWEIFAIGHTGISNRLDIDQRYWVTKNNPTVIPETRRTWGRNPNLSPLILGGERTRIVMQVSRLTGTAAYAISLRGAARIVYDQVLLPHAASIDTAISNLCRRNPYSETTPFCYGIYPMLIGRYRAIGPKTRDSDRRTSSNEAAAGSGGKQSTENRLLPESEFIVFPVSLNLGRLLAGKSTVMANDLGKASKKDIDLKSLKFPQGVVQWAQRQEYEVQASK